MYVPLAIAGVVEYVRASGSDPIPQGYWASLPKPLPIAHPPQLVLDRAPTPSELLQLGRELRRDRRMPRDGNLVCSIPCGDAEFEVKSLPYDVFHPVYFYEPKEENEIGKMVGWRIVVRFPS